jgi:methionine-rich copper-binding protein CopC
MPFSTLHKPRRTRRPGRWWGVVAAILGTAAVLLVQPVPPADAHTYLVSSSPAAGSTVSTRLTTVRLTFDEAVLDYGRGSSVLQISGPGPNGKHHETGCPKTDGVTVGAPVALGASGRYTVTWRVVSDDGHPVSGSFRFTYREPRGVAAASGTASGPGCGAAAGSDHRTGTSPSPATGGPLIWVLLGGVGLVLVLLVVALVVVVVVLRRRDGRQE